MPSSRNGGAKLRFFFDLPKVGLLFLSLSLVFCAFQERFRVYLTINTMSKTYMPSDNNSLAGWFHQLS